LLWENDEVKSGRSFENGPRLKFESETCDNAIKGIEDTDGDDDIEDEEAEEEER
jgi:hypothetical protein